MRDRTSRPSRLSHLECARCGRGHDAERLQQRCSCGGTLLARYDLRPIDLASVRARPAGMWRYLELLPPHARRVSIGEPETALVAAHRFSNELDLPVLVKDDSALPGGTFKARGAAVGVARARELGVTDVVMPSAGNAGGAWALYAARARMDVTVTLARSAPVANRTEVEIAGGRVELVDGTLADAGRRASEIASTSGAFLASTFSEPYRVEGKKTAWLELFDRLGDARSMRFPATIIIPVGGGVAAVAAAKAVDEVRALDWATGEAPVIIGVQSERCAPIARAFERGESNVEPWNEEPDTLAAGLRVPAPAEGALVIEVIRRAGGRVIAVSEDEILASVRDLASAEGLFVCPEGAATLAAARRVATSEELRGPVVLYNTGSGAKYVDAVAAAAEATTRIRPP